MVHLPAPASWALGIWMLTTGQAVPPPALELTVQRTPVKVAVDRDAVVVRHVGIGEWKDARGGRNVWKRGRVHRGASAEYPAPSPSPRPCVAGFTDCLSWAGRKSKRLSGKTSCSPERTPGCRWHPIFPNPNSGLLLPVSFLPLPYKQKLLSLPKVVTRCIPEPPALLCPGTSPHLDSGDFFPTCHSCCHRPA